MNSAVQVEITWVAWSRKY